MKKVLAHGTFDIVHYGHVRYLERAKKYGDYLIVYVTSDRLAKEKEKNPYFNEEIRMKMISSFKVVDEVILRDSEITPQMLEDLQINVMVTTTHYFDYLKDLCKIIHIERTKGISSTMIKEHLLEEK